MRDAHATRPPNSTEKFMPPRKRTHDEISNPAEPRLSDEQRDNFLHGIALFNAGRYWHAHEAWEATWLPMGNDREDDGEIFFRALIQLASGLHLKRKGRYAGAKNQLDKAAAKFAVLPARYLGLDPISLRIFASYQLAHFNESFTCLLQLRNQAGEAVRSVAHHEAELKSVSSPAAGRVK